MTGYNHYSNCACGWCVYSDRPHGPGGGNSGAFRPEFERRDAETFLKRHSVNSIAGCYLNPNARCPVCAVPVFFYANRFGSRVYFDDLGPPWPKLPCTDKPLYRTGPVKFPPAIATRPRGLATELLNAARITGHNVEENPWRMMQVEEVTTEANETKLRLKGLQPDEDVVVLSIGDANGIEKSDVVSVGDGKISYFDMTAFEPRVIVARQATSQATERIKRLRALVSSWMKGGRTNPGHIADLLNKSGAKCPWGGAWTWPLVMKSMNVQVKSVSIAAKNAAAMENTAEASRKRIARRHRKAGQSRRRALRK
jgi:hypothetical protein